MPASRSLIALLVGTVLFFALWLVALKPGGSSSGGSSSSQGLGQYQTDINKAHQAVGISNASNAASGNDGTSSSAPATSSAPAASSAPKASASGGASASKSTPTSHPATKSSQPSKIHLTAKVGAHNPATLLRLSTVQKAMSQHKVVAMLFYNPAATDDDAVKQELGGVATHRGKVVKLAIPLNEAANFTAVTQQVPVNPSPTLVLIAPGGQTGEIVGYSDQFEIAQRVDDALATK
jgi:hypothetical protein